MMNNKDSFEQRMKMVAEKHKSLMKIVDEKIVEINNGLLKIKKFIGLKWNGVYNETNTRASLKSS